MTSEMDVSETAEDDAGSYYNFVEIPSIFRFFWEFSSCSPLVAEMPIFANILTSQNDSQTNADWPTKHDAFNSLFLHKTFTFRQFVLFFLNEY